MAQEKPEAMLQQDLEAHIIDAEPLQSGEMTLLRRKPTAYQRASQELGMRRLEGELEADVLELLMITPDAYEQNLLVHTYKRLEAFCKEMYLNARRETLNTAVVVVGYTLRSTHGSDEFFPETFSCRSWADAEALARERFVGYALGYEFRLGTKDRLPVDESHGRVLSGKDKTKDTRMLLKEEKKVHA